MLYPDKRLPRWLMDAEYNKVIYGRVRKILGAPSEALSRLERMGVTDELVSDIIDHYGVKDKNISSEGDNELMNEIVQYIYDHYNENITLESLSDIFFWAPKVLSKKISRRLNVDLRVFINDIRLQKAVQMIGSPSSQDKSSDEILAQCGFANGAGL